MSIVCGVFGMGHKHDELVVHIEMNMEELRDFMETFSPLDRFREDLREAIDAMERRRERWKRKERDEDC